MEIIPIPAKQASTRKGSNARISSNPRVAAGKENVNLTMVNKQGWKRRLIVPIGWKASAGSPIQSAGTSTTHQRREHKLKALRKRKLWFFKRAGRFRSYLQDQAVLPEGWMARIGRWS